MIGARTKGGRVHLFKMTGGNSLCTAEGSRNPLTKGDSVLIPLNVALNDEYLCNVCRREYKLRVKDKDTPATKPAKKSGRQKHGT